MSDAVSCLDFPSLLNGLGDVAARYDIDDLASCASTNSLLLERAAQGAPSGSVVVTDEQTAGRGRLGRTWHSSPECSLTFSLLWKFPAQSNLSGLSLAVGVAIAQALEDLGVPGIGLKWPNDVWLHGRKIGGVLIELQFASTHAAAVIGIGLNLQRHPAWDALIDQALAAIAESGVAVSREAVLAAILRRMVSVLDCFAAEGFAPRLRAEWEARNALRGQAVRAVPREGEMLTGLCLGVAPDGALELESADGQRILVTVGDVSLRPDLAARP
ncbi:BirA family transcriptional regulator, biotin operon repressor / biotin-[acetyl-CoA-carboxylase] ligase [Formivibrio citricus]|uniref:biotin--[biotin carboxyl-carrier protein] ligase n=1 Tax=Formivibrio citricus TaxID=83765 RepID=A0A1I4XU16_9NEIS|nr:biotin--[acetyl-CoA-carboxylase] ligase [Formivibrio citricus]SFN28779.1 BirA family transcriptional regulator, biotin operon repressor / biotin-[acetyl-CoA-carboxylase] ligase [Formivibrio citricus]